MTLLINGVGLEALLQTSSGTKALAIREGCQIGLDAWYISFTVLCGVKLLIQLLRYLHVKTISKESVLFNLGGNFILMPLLFTVFFIYTQRLFENASPEVSRVMSPMEATRQKV